MRWRQCLGRFPINSGQELEAHRNTLGGSQVLDGPHTVVAECADDISVPIDLGSNNKRKHPRERLVRDTLRSLASCETSTSLRNSRSVACQSADGMLEIQQETQKKRMPGMQARAVCTLQKQAKTLQSPTTQECVEMVVIARACSPITIQYSLFTMQAVCARTCFYCKNGTGLPCLHHKESSRGWNFLRLDINCSGLHQQDSPRSWDLLRLDSVINCLHRQESSWSWNSLRLDIQPQWPPPTRPSTERGPLAA
jgi:hypothetical protein